MKLKEKNKFVFATILTFFILFTGIFTSSSYAETTLPDYIIRIYLKTYNYQKSLSFKETGTYKLLENDKELKGSFTAKIEGSKIVISDENKTYKYTSLTLKASDYNLKNTLKINDYRKFSGDINLSIENGYLRVINITYIEHYLIGVVPYEIGDESPIEALKAQTIAARTFAYYKIKSINRANKDYDVDNTTACQVYYGYDANNKNTIKAVEKTFNKVLLDKKGKYIYVCYGASNGGRTEYPVSSGAAGSNLPYMPGYVKDDADLKASLSSNFYSAKIEIPKTLNLTKLKAGKETVYKMLKGKLEKKIDLSKIKSAKVSKITLTDNKFSKPKRCYNGAKIVVKVKTSSETNDYTLVYPPYEKNGYVRPFLNDILLSAKLKFYMLCLQENEKSFTLASVRYGHGTGMSQIGAIYRAKHGDKVSDILKFYYLLGTETKLKKMSWTLNGSEQKEIIKLLSPKSKSVVGKTGKVNVTKSQYLNFRQKPSLTAKVLKTLKRNAKVVIKGTSGNFYKAVYSYKSSGKTKKITGYVSKDYITIL